MFKPGPGPDELWETTMKMEMAGMTMGGDTQQVCIKKGRKDADVVPKSEECTMTDVRTSGNRTTFSMVCKGDPHLPDHGEVWSIPWKLESMQGGLTLSVDGRSFPYHFVRSVTLVSPDTLELRYSLANTGQKALPYLWAAHPQFAANTDTRIVFPPEVTQVVNVIEDDPVWGKGRGGFLAGSNVGNRPGLEAGSRPSGGTSHLPKVLNPASTACLMGCTRGRTPGLPASACMAV